MAEHVWIADDEESIRWVLEKACEKQRWRCALFNTGTELLAKFQTHARPKVVITDLRMPGISGHVLLSEIKQLAPEIPVIIMTAFADLESTIASFSEGAFEYVAKPFDTTDVVRTIERALAHYDSLKVDATEDIQPDVETDGIIGRAPSMQEAYRAIAKLANSISTVLITGESGTGKELIAKALQRHSLRADKPFVALNMAALPNELIEAELFGHEKGAFTGADTLRRGRFEQAHEGTLFLDEIGDMPMEAQTRLLRVLAEGSFYRVGGMHTIEVDVRIIAATNQNLENLVADGGFREDLYHRLNVIRIHVPPLRERREDIEELAQRFLLIAAKQQNKPAKRLTPPLLEFLTRHPWPGNVRQLENVCHWLTVMTSAQDILLSDLPPELTDYDQPQEGQESNKSESWEAMLALWTLANLSSERPIFHEARSNLERVIIKTTLDHTNGNRSHAARLLNMQRNTLNRIAGKLKQ